ARGGGGAWPLVGDGVVDGRSAAPVEGIRGDAEAGADEVGVGMNAQVDAGGPVRGDGDGRVHVAGGGVGDRDPHRAGGEVAGGVGAGVVGRRGLLTGGKLDGPAVDLQAGDVAAAQADEDQLPAAVGVTVVDVGEVVRGAGMAERVEPLATAEVGGVGRRAE